MKLACVRAIADLAQAEQSDVVAMAYEGEELKFGPEYIIPKQFDPRLIIKIAPAVAKAAMDSGVATRPIADLDAYRDRLAQFVHRSGLIMKPVFALAKQQPRRVIFAEGEDERVLRAVQIVVDEKLAKPVLIGRPEVVEMRIEKFGLRMTPGREFEIVNRRRPALSEVWTEYYRIMRRRASPDDAKARANRPADRRHAASSRRWRCHAVHFRPAQDHLRRRQHHWPGAGADFCGDERADPAAADRVRVRYYVNEDPTAEQLAESRSWLRRSEALRTTPVALLSHSISDRRLGFGGQDEQGARSGPAARPGPEVEGDARRCRAVREIHQPRLSRFAAEGGGTY